MDTEIFLEEHQRQKDMNRYNLMHIIESHSNYGYEPENDIDDIVNSESNKRPKSLAKYIHNNFDKMDEDEMRETVNRCLTDKCVKRLLLKFELENYYPVPRKRMTINEFQKEAVKILQRYTHKAGGFLLEDREWSIHGSNSIDYDVAINEVLFENSVDKFDLTETDTKRFLSLILKQLENIASNIDVSVRHKGSKGDNLTFIIIFAVDKTRKENKSKISL